MTLNEPVIGIMSIQMNVNIHISRVAGNKREILSHELHHTYLSSSGPHGNSEMIHGWKKREYECVTCLENATLEEHLS